MKNNIKCNKKMKGFTLVELIVVIAIIGILSAILIPSILEYIEKARNTADLMNARDICNALQAATALAPNHVINYETPWKDDENNKDHGYVYIDDDEVRVSHVEIAYILEEEGIIKPGCASDYKLRHNVEPQYSKDKINITCKSRKNWNRYQINFVFKNGELEFSYNASKNGLAKDPETTAAFASKIKGKEGGSEISLGGMS